MHASKPLDRFPSIHLLCVGDAILDRYLTGAVAHLCREAPAPVVRVDEHLDRAGGAANAALNAADLGAQVTFLSTVGDDDEGRQVTAGLEAHGIRTRLVRAPGRRTVTKRRVVVDSQILIRLDDGDTRPPPDAAVQEMLAQLDDAWRHADAVLVSDYAAGAVGDAVVARIGELRRAHPRPLFVDARDPARFRRVAPTAIKPNFDETLRLLPGFDGTDDRVAFVAGNAASILARTGASIAAVTLDRDGAVVLERDRPPYRTYTTARPNVRTTGAGDTFTAAFSLALAAGCDTPAAAEIATAAAAVVVAKEQTATCTADELRERLQPETKYLTDVSLLTRLADMHRNRGRRIVFTNGCFDILHRGHITYLSEAKALGDVLIVGINSDESVRALKGPGRPVNRLEDRMEVLAALGCVDLVVPFEGETADDLIAAVRPHVFVKGGDYTEEMLPEARVVRALGGEVRLLPYVEDRSTTGVIERIRGVRTVRLDEDASDTRALS